MCYITLSATVTRLTLLDSAPNCIAEHRGPDDTISSADVHEIRRPQWPRRLRCIMILHRQNTGIEGSYRARGKSVRVFVFSDILCR